LQAVSTATSPVGTFGDKLRIGKLRLASRRGTLDELYARSSESTIERLRSLAFTEGMIDQFFRPFLGGVFLDESLATSSRMMEFVFRMFAGGEIAIPADGMAAIPRQLAESLPRGTLRLNATVQSIDFGAESCNVQFTDGEVLAARKLVVATESNAAARLLNRPEWVTEWNSTTNLYFAAEKSPETSKLLMLRGDESGPIQTAVVLSDVAPEYASGNRALVSITVGDEYVDQSTAELESAVRQQAIEWFGPDAARWELVQTYRVPYGLPRTDLDPVKLPIRLAEMGASGAPQQVFVCGDHRETPSIQGAMNSGLRVAQAILGDDSENVRRG
jgi:phytoene dehydrogenase-like protein